MRIGKQKAGRDILNYELHARGASADVGRQLSELEGLVRRAVESGAVGRGHAAALDSAARDVAEAAGHPGRGSSRLVRALEGLKNLSAAAASTAGIAEAADTIIHSVTGP